MNQFLAAKCGKPDFILFLEEEISCHHEWEIQRSSGLQSRYSAAHRRPLKNKWRFFLCWLHLGLVARWRPQVLASWAHLRVRAFLSQEPPSCSKLHASSKLPFMLHQSEWWVTNPFPHPSLEGKRGFHGWFRLLRIYPGSWKESLLPPSHIKSVFS